jgi:hypothetical protein
VAAPVAAALGQMGGRFVAVKGAVASGSRFLRRGYIPRVTRWVSHPQAAEIMGVGKTTIQRLIARGELHPRKAAPRYPSLDRAEVQAVAERCWQAERQRIRAAQRRKAPKYPPPPGEHVWLTASQAARLVGITVPGIAKRVRRETIPFVVYKGRRWFRADHMESLGRARRARHLRQPA